MDAMSLLAQALAFVAALIHVFFFYAESVTFARPETWRRFGLQTQEQADIVRPMAYNQGFYNLFLAIGAIGGVIAANLGYVEAGRALVLLACGSMAAAGIVLMASDRRFVRSGLIQAVPPLIALAALFV
jgi:putative membrane protein